ncbi:hypothetical protein CLV58_15316 [Spirosoma oryzae]|uniref:Uncharacterized protein n=1 Tax=Spirosoma oryzae TaxID=1469603 RepID=A0A2T0RIT9_9BACT|nr:hypothetical protein [Spirosoma oryzae]PRY21126.1 hypothetical protein CLV58_15316 [Spirosoma oryzae]
MTIKAFSLLFIGLVPLTASYAQVALTSSNQTTDSVTAILGQWVGTFEGASSGKLELALQQDSNTRQLGGQLTVIISDGERYTTKLKKVVFSQNRFTASYTEPSDGSDVTLTGELKGTALTGEWTVNDGQGKGTWQAIHPVR